jgi:hypothetical protein
MCFSLIHNWWWVLISGNKDGVKASNKTNVRNELEVNMG